MATHYPAPDPIQSTFLIPGSNTPGSGAQVFFYTNLSSTKTTVYADSAGATPWANPIVLDSGGNLPSGGQVYIVAGETLTVRYAPSNDTDPPVSVYRTLNDIAGVNDVSATTSEWITGPTPTFVSTTSFTLVGDQTATFQIGRRVRTTNTGGTVYSRITNSAFTALTTITVVNDSGTLDSGLSAVAYGLLSSANASIPAQRDISLRFADATDPSKTASLELGGLATSTEVALSVQNTTGVLSLISEYAYLNVASTGGRLLYPAAYIQGLVPSNPTASTVSVSTGVTVNSSGMHNLILSAPITKVLTSSWSVSSNGGGLLDTGAISTNIWYYGHAIKSTTSGWVDMGYSSSFAAPTLPTGYTVKSNVPVASVYEVANTTVAFTATEMEGGGLDVLWTTPTLDVNLASTLTSTKRTDAIKVPPDFPVIAHLNAVIGDSGGGGAIIYSPVQSNLVPSATSAPLLNLTLQAAGQSDATQLKILTTSAIIAARATSGNTIDTYAVATMGFTWSRR